MVIREVTVTGIDGVAQEVTIAPTTLEEGEQNLFSNPIVLSPSISPELFYKLIRAVLYPTVTSREVERLLQSSDDPQVSIIVTQKELRFRILRGAMPESLTLQIETTRRGELVWETQAKGAKDVDERLEGQLERLPVDAFGIMTSWCDPTLFYQTNAFEDAIDDAIVNDISVNSLLIMYEKARHYEEANAQVGKLAEELLRRSGIYAREKANRVTKRSNEERETLEREIREIRAEIGDLALGDFTEKELADVRESDRILANAKREIHRLEESRDAIAQEIAGKAIRPWMVDPRFLIPAFIAFIALFTPFFLPPDMSWVSLISIPFIALAAVILVRSASTMNLFYDTLRKLHRVEGRIAEEIELQATAKQRLAHFYLATGSPTVALAEGKFARKAQLESTLHQKEAARSFLLEQLGSSHPNQESRFDASQIRVEQELNTARSHLDDVERPELPSSIIAHQLERQGLKPPNQTDNSPEREALYHRESLLILYATHAGLLSNGALLPQVEKLWNEFLHAFMHNSLVFCVRDSRIEIDEEKSQKAAPERWKEERLNVLRWALFSLNCAIVEYAQAVQQHTMIPHTIFCLHPFALQRPDDQQRLKRIISATRKVGWILVHPTSG